MYVPVNFLSNCKHVTSEHSALKPQAVVVKEVNHLTNDIHTGLSCLINAIDYIVWAGIDTVVMTFTVYSNQSIIIIFNDVIHYNVIRLQLV